MRAEKLSSGIGRWATTAAQGDECGTQSRRQGPQDAAYSVRRAIWHHSMAKGTSTRRKEKADRPVAADSQGGGPGEARVVCTDRAAQFLHDRMQIADRRSPSRSTIAADARDTRAVGPRVGSCGSTTSPGQPWPSKGASIVVGGARARVYFGVEGGEGVANGELAVRHARHRAGRVSTPVRAPEAEAGGAGVQSDHQGPAPADSRVHVEHRPATEWAEARGPAANIQQGVPDSGIQNPSEAFGREVGKSEVALSRQSRLGLVQVRSIIRCPSVQVTDFPAGLQQENETWQSSCTADGSDTDSATNVARARTMERRRRSAQTFLFCFFRGAPPSAEWGRLR